MRDDVAGADISLSPPPSRIFATLSRRETVRPIRTGRVDTEEVFGRRAVKWIGPPPSKGISIFQLSYPMTQRILWLELVNLDSSRIVVFLYF